ncbi:RNA-directed DNA polymerase from mobile element jockey [Varanus komodoensis]|nr:RNA-directed DNA polymerase from mobile element jockey [Varanus komodoensis]
MVGRKSAIKREYKLEVRDGRIDRQMVKEYLDGINTFKSPGPSELHPRVIKELEEELSEPLAIIFDKSWKTGEVPDDWRRANVVPIFKRGNMAYPCKKCKLVVLLEDKVKEDEEFLDRVLELQQQRLVQKLEVHKQAELEEENPEVKENEEETRLKSAGAEELEDTLQLWKQWNNGATFNYLKPPTGSGYLSENLKYPTELYLTVPWKNDITHMELKGTVPPEQRQFICRMQMVKE